MKFRNLRRSIGLYQSEKPSINLILDIMMALIDDAEDESRMNVCELDMGDQEAVTGLGWLCHEVTDIFNGKKDEIESDISEIEIQLSRMGEAAKMLWKYEELEKTLEKQKEKYADLCEQAARAEQKREEYSLLKQKCDGIEAALAAESPQDLQQKREHLGELQTRLNTLTSQKNKLSDDIRYTDHRILCLRNKEIPDLQNKADAARNQKEASESRKQSISNEIEQSKTAAEDISRECSSLETELKALKDAEPELQKRRGALILEKEQQQKRLDTYKEDNITPLENKIGEIQTKLGGLENKEKELQQKKTELTEKVGYYEAQIPLLKEQIDKQQTELDKVTKDCEQAEELIRNLQTKTKENQELSDQLIMTKIPAAAEAEKTAKADAEAKQKILEGYEGTINELNERISSFNQQIGDKKKELDILLPQVQTLQNNLKVLSERYQNNNKELKRLDVNIQDLESKTDNDIVSTLRVQKETKIEELKGLQEQQIQLEKENKGLSEQITELSGEIALITENNTQLEIQRVQSEDLKKQLESPYTLEQLNEMIRKSGERLAFLQHSRDSIMRVVSDIRSTWGSSMTPDDQEMDTTVRICFEELDRKLKEYQKQISEYAAKISGELN